VENRKRLTQDAADTEAEKAEVYVGKKKASTLGKSIEG
jgi:hypothetical protein